MADSYIPTPMSMSGMDQPSQPPLLVMGMSQKEYQTAFMYLDHANFTREAEEFEIRAAGPMLLPPLPWYKRPEFWAIILGAFSLVHGLFVQWAWPKIQRDLNKGSPFAAPRLCDEDL
ncbi:hypothetical protein HD806DRAFT_278847 [Xylariaceae sp. AK1471]|nr:hypothetical protein HD806DRAFT_278847 [Xylariaceae sp. AK1471]